jgi:hypothetical protein
VSDNYEKVTAAVGASILFSAFILAAAPISAGCGALAGMTVGWFFGNTIIYVLGQLGLHNVALWQLGATLGFLSSFLRTSTTVKK